MKEFFKGFWKDLVDFVKASFNLAGRLFALFLLIVLVLSTIGSLFYGIYSVFKIDNSVSDRIVHLIFGLIGSIVGAFMTCLYISEVIDNYKT
ncbi:hypothetical protein AGMMS4957_19680 [Bacteroidia bacterium]|nr:hypothetical protein AGMMS4957_19680 [Bacteroidia bacterium]